MNLSIKNDSMREILLLLLISFMVFLIYSNTFSSPFLFDDWQNIQDNPHIRLNRLTLDGIKHAAFESPHPNRLFANISFALNYYFNQYNVFGYHVVNIHRQHLDSRNNRYISLSLYTDHPGNIPA